MTWVIGASTIWRYGTVVSDIQVTFADGATVDLLQKAYPVGNSIVVGFAGSVRVGFALTESLRRFLLVPPNILSTHAWDPIWVANNWAPVAREVYEAQPKQERDIGSQVLLVGAHPNRRDPILGAESVIARFSAPRFKPGIMTKTIKLCSIGSGAGIAEYKRAIKPLFRFASGLNMAEIGGPGHWGQMLGFSISRTLNNYPRAGISRHLHVFNIHLGRITMGTNDERLFPKEGPPVDILMPRVATNYEEFLLLARERGCAESIATC